MAYTEDKQADGLDAKVTPVDADCLTLWDSVAGLLSKVTWANLKAKSFPGLSLLTGIPKGDGATPTTFSAADPGSDYLSPIGGAAPVIINSGFAGTIGSVGTTVTFSSAADAILAGYNSANTKSGIGCTIIAGAQTRYIMSWSNATTCVVDTAPAPAWAATAITSVQLPIAVFIDSAGVVQGWMTAAGLVYFVGNVGIGTTAPVAGSRLHVLDSSGATTLAVGNPDVIGNDSSDGTIRFYGEHSGVVYSSTISKASSNLFIRNESADGSIYLDGGTDTGGHVVLNYSGGGYVGIGTAAPVFKTDVVGGIYSRLRHGRLMFDDAPMGTQLESTPSAGIVVTAGTNYAASNVTLQAGGVQAITAAADDDSVTILHALPINTSQNPKFSFRFKVDSIANAYIAVGLTTAAFADKAVLPDNCAMIGIDADNGHAFGAARLVLTTKDDGAAVDYDDLGVDMVNNTWVWGVADLTDTEQPRVWIAGTEIAAGSITGTVKDATAFYLYFHVQNLAGGAHTLTAVCDQWQQDQPA